MEKKLFDQRVVDFAAATGDLDSLSGLKRLESFLKGKTRSQMDRWFQGFVDATYDAFTNSDESSERKMEVLKNIAKGLKAIGQEKIYRDFTDAFRSLGPKEAAIEAQASRVREGLLGLGDPGVKALLERQTDTDPVVPAVRSLSRVHPEEEVRQIINRMRNSGGDLSDITARGVANLVKKLISADKPGPGLAVEMIDAIARKNLKGLLSGIDRDLTHALMESIGKDVNGAQLIGSPGLAMLKGRDLVHETARRMGARPAA
ncbi:MAG: hypothetical protein M3O22_05310 [Pseudomonadota bacterium]|nr:hypothetical protein [Pseudomonadota bacterium]